MLEHRIDVFKFKFKLASSLFHVCRRMERVLFPPVAEPLGRNSTDCPFFPKMPLCSVGPLNSKPSSNTFSYEQEDIIE